MNVLWLSVVVVAGVFLLAESSAFGPLRLWLNRRPWGLSVGVHRFTPAALLRCGYCLGHWLAAAGVLLCPVRLGLPWAWPWLDVPATMLAVAWLAALQWAALRRLVGLKAES